MQKLKIFQVDAFADTLFKGNPAAVCLLEKWLDDSIMQSIAMENNLSETAFIVPDNDRYEIRWFTPASEVDLCGHATLASAFVLFLSGDKSLKKVHFVSKRSGNLFVSRLGDLLTLDFPVDLPKPIVGVSDKIADALDVFPQEVFQGKHDLVAIYENEDMIREIQPDFRKIAEINTRGLIITAKGDHCDFVSRFFAPGFGIDEDPVTGSAHTLLMPVWAEKLKKTKFHAQQLSQRGGNLICELKDDRCLIGGKAFLYLQGEILL